MQKFPELQYTPWGLLLGSSMNKWEWLIGLASIWSITSSRQGECSQAYRLHFPYLHVYVGCCAAICAHLKFLFTGWITGRMLCRVIGKVHTIHRQKLKTKFLKKSKLETQKVFCGTKFCHSSSEETYWCKNLREKILESKISRSTVPPPEKICVKKF